MELRPRRYEQNKSSMANMQDAFKQQANTLQTCMQHDIMHLHAKTHKFHIDHSTNGATVQHLHTKQDITIVCPKTTSRHIVDIKTT